MNKRILELAKQAGIKANSEQAMSPQEQLFAELIVGECVKVAIFKDSGMVATADVAGHMAAGRSIAARMINEHFGVER